jgi:alkylated DNA repair protein alkB family protein 6
MAARGTGDAWLPSSLEAARIASLPSTAYYLPNFISEEEERLILDKVRLAAVAGAVHGAGRLRLQPC